VLRHLLLVQQVLGSNPKPIISLTRCQQLATIATLIANLWALAQSCGDGHCPLVTPERVLSEYNKYLIFLLNSELDF